MCICTDTSLLIPYRYSQTFPEPMPALDSHQAPPGQDAVTQTQEIDVTVEQALRIYICTGILLLISYCYSQTSPEPTPALGLSQATRQDAATQTELSRYGFHNC